jgi:hypothetical protein
MERHIPLDELRPQLRRLDIALEAHDARAVRAVLNKILELDFAGAGRTATVTAPDLSPISLSTS